MICLACRGVTSGDLCRRCRGHLASASDRWLPQGVLVRSGHLHDGPARDLVHRLKYEGLVAAADRLAEAMAPLVESASELVPVPRTLMRRHRFGVDPAQELARAVARLTGAVVVDALAAPLRSPVHAGRSRSERVTPAFRVRRPVDAAACLVDDVVTTGVTLGAAAESLGTAWAVTATSRILGSSSG